ncbi:uncharacterized protein CBL_10184 [Carabus blaptoides fortunei]
MVANTIHGFFVRIGVCRKVVRKFDMANPTGITISIPGIDPHDMERRRQIALKALSERLSKNTDHHSSKDRQPLLPKSSPKVTFMNPPASVNVAFTQDKTDPQPGTSNLSTLTSQSTIIAQQTSQQLPRITSQTYVTALPTSQTIPRSTSLAFVPQTSAQMTRSASASYVPQLASQQNNTDSRSSLENST